MVKQSGISKQKSQAARSSENDSIRSHINLLLVDMLWAPFVFLSHCLFIYFFINYLPFFFGDPLTLHHNYHPFLMIHYVLFFHPLLLGWFRFPRQNRNLLKSLIFPIEYNRQFSIHFFSLHDSLIIGTEYTTIKVHKR